MLILLTGQPGSPQDWPSAGRLAHLMNAFVAAHLGPAVIVVVPDATGGPSPTRCASTPIRAAWAVGAVVGFADSSAFDSVAAVACSVAFGAAAAVGTAVAVAGSVTAADESVAAAALPVVLPLTVLFDFAPVVPLTVVPLTVLPLTVLPLTVLPLTVLPLTVLPLTAGVTVTVTVGFLTVFFLVAASVSVPVKRRANSMPEKIPSLKKNRDCFSRATSL